MARKLTLALLALCAVCFAANRAAAQTLDEAFAALPNYKLGDGRKGLDVINQEVVKSYADPQARAVLAARLAAILATNASHDAKDFVLRQLYITATKSEIPAVAKLLTDEKLSHMSRYVLEAMAVPEADAAMRTALGQTTGKLRIGMINSLGNRRDAASAAAIIALLDDAEAGPAAANALGKIATPEACAAVKGKISAGNATLKDAAVDAYLLCADAMLAAGKKAEAAAIYNQMREDAQPRRVQVAALRGLVLADPAAAQAILINILKADESSMATTAAALTRELTGPQVAAGLAAALPTLSPVGQVVMLDALQRRGDAAAKPAVLAAIKNADPAISAAAIKAVGSLGDGSDVPTLVGLTATGTAEQKSAAREALAALKDKSTDAAILKALDSASGEAKAELIKTLAARQATSATASLFKLAAADPAEPNRIAALEALGALSGEADYPQLVGLLVAAKADGERNAASNALIAASQRMKDREASVGPIVAAMGSAPAEGKVMLINALSRVGGEKAIAPVRDAFKGGDAKVKEAAFRALTQWPDTTALPDLLAVVKTGDQKQQVLAVRGLVRIVGQRSDRSNADTLKLYQQILDAAQRPDEKKLVLGGIGDVRDAAAYDMVTPFLADKATANEAASAIIKIANNLKNAQKNKTLAALNKIAASPADDTLKKRAEETKNK